MPCLGYTKSRTGCQRCRQRRVKCDEKRPCTACTRHNVTCSLITNPPVIPIPKKPRTRRKPRINPKTTQEEDNGNILGSLPATLSHRLFPSSLSLSSASSLSSSSSASYSSSSHWTLDDLGLMCHYCTVACLTLPRAGEGPAIRRIWQTVVVELALAHAEDALMHQLLAVTAFHLAYQKNQDQQDQDQDQYLFSSTPSTKFSILASQHQGDAMQKLQSQVVHVTEANCHVLFATASLLVIGGYASHSIRLASPCCASTPLPTMEDILDVFMLTRGMNAILHMYEPVVQAGPMGGLFRLGDVSISMSISLSESLSLSLSQPRTTATTEFLSTIRQRLCDIHQDLAMERLASSSSSSSSSSTAGDIEAVSCALDAFLAAIDSAIHKASEPSLRIVMFFPIAMSEAFLQRLRARQPLALVVFAHLAAIIHHTANRGNDNNGGAWYLRGIGAAMADDIEKTIRQADAGCLLSTVWKDGLEWSLQYIREVADETRKDE